MKKHRLQYVLRNAILIALLLVFAGEPALVAARTLQKDPQAQAIDQILQGGEVYLDSLSAATVESAELLGVLNVVQTTPIDGLNEAYIGTVIERALQVAEQTSVALGSVDDLADGSRQLSTEFPAAMDAG